MTLQDAQRKAKYGHKDWISWVDRNSLTHVEPQSQKAIKQALLAVGTQGRFVIIEANTGWLHKTGWWVGLNIIRQYKRGIR